MAVGEAILTASFQVMLEKLCSWIPTNVGFVWGIDKELRKLGRTLSKIQAVLNDAEEKQNWDMSVKIWLDELKHVAFDVEDVLDEFATEVQRSTLEADAERDGNQVKNLILYLSKNVISSKLGIASKIKEILERLDDIARERDELGLRERVVEIEIRKGLGRPKTSSLVDVSGVYGRESDKNKIIELLLEDNSTGNTISVIPVVGMCGIGKTTVAQLVYNDERVEAHFDLRAWACVSEEFDVTRITKAILESATRVPCAFENLDPLQVNLKELLHEKRVLLVLDDVQNDLCSEWDVLKAPFQCAMHGSKIIITTTSKVVLSTMGTTPAHLLEGLSDDNCLSLLRKHALTDMNFSTNPNVEEYEREIVKKCGGSPLAAKRFGYLLHSKLNVDEWKDISTHEIWEIRDGNSDIMASLRVTYQKLPAHLKRCFAYCSVFPKYYTFKKETLILLWMAEGLVQSIGRRTMEEVGNEYFQDLLLNSFFLQCGSDKSWFMIHPLFHDLAQSVLGDVCVRCTASDTCVISDKTRYLSFLPVRHEPIKFEELYAAMSLRSLLILCQDDMDLAPIKQFPYDLFLMLRSLRVLCLTNLPTSDLPDSIGTLKHLRFLDLSNTGITRLPESVSSLYYLQTLLLNDCRKLIELPMDFGNLINLRHLRMVGCDKLKKMPDGVGRLTNIQTCSDFFVGKTNGSGVSELGNLFQLRGELTIARLENVVNNMDAVKANMKMKQYLHTLILKWSDIRGSSRDAESEEQTANFLQPHVNLKILVIMSYGGLRFPSWIRLLYNLVKVKLSGCRRCVLLPPLGHLPLLKILEISEMNSIKQVGREFCGDGLLKGFLALETLTFSNMATWEDWSGVEEGEEFPRLDKLKIENCPMLKGFSCQFPRLRKMVIKECDKLISLPRTLQEEVKTFSCLRKVQIWNCPNLLVLPPFFPSLDDLNLKNCQILVLPMLPSLVHLKVEKCNARIFTSMPDLPSLRELCISNITELECIPRWFFRRLTTLECLRIECCRELLRFEDEVGFHLLHSLKQLEILDCPRLLSFPEEQLPTSLQHFKLRNCSSLVSFPQALHNLACLVDLEIHYAPEVASFSEPGLPARLQKLMISHCDKIELLPKGLCDLSSLANLYLEYCPFLTTFPEGGLPTTLRLLWIKECDRLRVLPEKMHVLTSLQELKVKNCPLLAKFPEEGLPNSLKLLEITGCEILELSPVRVLHKLALLSDLVIDGCPVVMSSLKEEWLLPTNLEYLTLKQCEGLEFLPKGLHNLASLVSLWINDAPSIASLPEEGLPFSLQDLYVTASPLLADLCLKEKVRDRSKVAHVPNITIF